MNIEQLVLAFPSHATVPTGRELTVWQWSALAEQFAAQGGRELLLAGAEPLDYPGFWPVVRRALKSGMPRVTAYLSGSLLEPRVCRELIESGVHLLIALDSFTPEPHDSLHGAGSHARALIALERFLKDGIAGRLGVLATATQLGCRELPVLAAWAAGKGVDRFLWSTVPDGGWPSPQSEALRLLPVEKTELAAELGAVTRSITTRTYVGPADPLEDPTLGSGYSRTLRVQADGEAYFGFTGASGYLGNLKGKNLQDTLNRSSLEAGD
ncbi:MAG TPA: radical SAM protein [Symbiobacteriaceae bacterium]|jgi:MoaA/NifB/PqqE/SkfB family radical SAM enzyme